MRAIIQRVKRASVTVDDEVIGDIGKGLCVLVGITRDDIPLDLDFMAKKIAGIRLFDDSEGNPWTKSAKDVGGGILLVSQFTLCAQLKGNRPDYHDALDGSLSEGMFNQLVEQVKKIHGDNVATGRFGADMDVMIVNDGPCTIEIDSRKSEYLESSMYSRVGQKNVEKYFRQLEKQAQIEANRKAKAALKQQQKAAKLAGELANIAHEAEAKE
ncbi:D-tyrosyl-tRNA(Tyr) deacylase [Carpediemonas membranifera]|uniref:D-aminoacyl-tRNA deacylase n=1 Tax=Carpediemonas membranifera TaxID=201153 RepID=A0A8J6E5B8_9EUKA|nr:D-tyrosyl-tRNA(Tyr) deacylase [Carpediemonas membranifera]|eukprot:KAG9395542.1 D-tyrosyl-tRNA(Tyr) deacylase [Carpediemonas membranifera]